MSENVELVQRAIKVINRADFDAVAEIVSEDFELDFSNSRGPLSGVYRGREGALDFLQTFFEAWTSVEYRGDEFIDLSGGRVLEVGGLRTRGHTSGVEVSASGATIWTIGNGKVVAAKMYQSKDEALEAARP
jgi:ketosteroid isomerase-like protein